MASITDITDCSICLHPLPESDSECAQLDCSHNTFHRNCIKIWTSGNPTCPLCRTEVRQIVVNEEKILILPRQPDLVAEDVEEIGLRVLRDMQEAERRRSLFSDIAGAMVWFGVGAYNLYREQPDGAIACCVLGTFLLIGNAALRRR